MGDEDDTEATRSHYQSLDRSIERGDVVVSVICNTANVDQVVRILEATNPLKIDEHEMGVAPGTTTTGTGTTDTGVPYPAASTSPATSGVSGTTSSFANQGTVTAGTSQATGLDTGRVGTESERIPIHEEQLDVGKQRVTGTATVRRYVTQRPVEEQVRLRDERIRIERRPVDRDVSTADDAFTEKRVDITETSERPVVEKVARVVEEVVVNKDVNERVETVRDTVRKEDVEVTRDDARAGTASNVESDRVTHAGTTATGAATTGGETFEERHPNLAHPVETVKDKVEGEPTPAQRQEGKIQP
jgi:uncharacterized protein (TIGR02271 family)